MNTLYQPKPIFLSCLWKVSILIALLFLIQSAQAQVNCTGLPAWSSAAVYTQGDQVQHNNTGYEAKWWTQNEDPATHSGQWDVWINLGACGSGGNTPPNTSITSPSNGATFTAGATITINASASDPDGTVSKVAFYQNGNLLGEDTSSPYSYSWSGAAAGNYNLTAVATDNDNASTTSSAVSITVQSAGNNPPSGSITAPSDGATFTQGSNIAISASASDADGSVSKVEFFQNGNYLGEDTSSPYSYTWSNVSQGSYTLSIVITDNLGATTTPGSVSVTVQGSTGGDCNGIPQYTEGGGYNAGSEVQNVGSVYQCKEWPYSGWCNGGAQAYAPGTGTNWQDAWNLIGQCGGDTGGNDSPTVNITSPSNGSTFTPGSTINLTASASDPDGSVAKVEFFQNGNLLGEDTSSPYSYSWANVSAGSYTLAAKATDNEGASTTSTQVYISVTSGGNPSGDLPDRVLVGYWHNFDNGSGVVKLRDISDKWDVINIAFAEPTVQGGSSMSFVPDNSIYSTTQEFKNDVALLQSQGKKVLISIGGANGTIHLENATHAQNFSSTMTSIINEYGFDGLDIDLEGTSLSLGAGDNDFRFPTSPRVVNFINGMEAVLANFGSDFVLTAAPETAYVQGGYSTYGGIYGAYLPVLYALKDRMALIHVQHYNTGCMLGLDNQCYSQGTADFQVAMGEMLLRGFSVAGNPTSFPAFREDQVAIGLPASPSAAGGGYTNPNTVKTALDYLIKGISYGGNYTLVNGNGYSGFRGMMTWSINWDINYGYEFSNNYRAYLDALPAARWTPESPTQTPEVLEEVFISAPNPFSDWATITVTLNEAQETSLVIYNQVGQQIGSLHHGTLQKGTHTFEWDSRSTKPGLYFARMVQGEQTRIIKLIKK